MLRNSIYNTLGGIVKIGVGIMSVPLLIQILNFNQYGLYIIIISITSFAILSEQSISTTITVFVAKDLSSSIFTRNQLLAETLKVTAYLVLLISISTGIILYITAPFIAKLFSDLSLIDKETLIICCQISSLVVCIRLLQQFFIGLQQAYQRYATLNLITSFFNTFLTVVGVFCAWYYYKIVSILIGQLVVCIIFTLIHAFVCYKQNLFSARLFFTGWVDNIKLKEISIYSFRIWITTLGGNLFTQGDKLILASILPLYQIGLYSAMCNLVNQINVFSSLPVQPIISSLIATDEETSIAANTKIVLHNTNINSTIALGLGSIFIIFNTEILTYFISPNKELDTNIKFLFMVLVTIYTLYSLNAVGYYSLFGLKKEKLNAYIGLLAGFITIVLIVFLSISFGIWGAVIGNSGYLLTLSLPIISFKLLKMPLMPFVKVYLIPILVFFLSFFSLFTNNILWMKLILASILMSLLIYNFLNIFFKPVCIPMPEEISRF